MFTVLFAYVVFFFNDTATTEIYTLSLHDALPIYLSVSARIRVIDPFSQMKREYNTILDDAESANRDNFVPSQSFTWCSPGNFSQDDQYLQK